MDNETTIRQFLKDECYLKVEEIENDSPLFSNNTLSSLDLIDLISFLEESFGFKVDPFEIKSENLDSINLIDEFIKAKS